VAFGLFAVFNVRTGADVSKMMPEELPSRKASQRISDIFGPQNSDVILVEGDIYDPANLVALLELEDAIAADERNQPGNDDYFLRDNIQSIADLIVLSSPDGSLPDSRQEVENVVSILGTRMPVSAFVTEDGESAMIILKSGFPETEDEFIVKADIMRDQSAVIMGETDLKLTSTGMTVLIGDLLGNILPTQLKTSGLALLLCALVLILVFKSFTFGLATLIVVVIGMMAELVFLYALGWPLDIMTVMVASLVIGAGIDFGIHITHRFREEWQDGEVPLEEAIKKTVLHVGRALVAAAFTTCGVFIILGFSSMEMMKRFGYATAVGLAGALLGAIIVLPSILAIATKSRSRRLSSAVAPPQEAGAEPAPEETT
jgi:predicted RND superfamily exporter protein